MFVEMLGGLQKTTWLKHGNQSYTLYIRHLVQKLKDKKISVYITKCVIHSASYGIHKGIFKVQTPYESLK
jgi:hypothetical protein